MRKLLWFSFTCYLVFLNGNQLRAQPLIELDEVTKLEVTDNYYTFLADTTKALSIKDVLTAPPNYRFQPPTTTSYKKGHNVYWIHLRLQNKTDFDREYVLDFQNWSYVDLYRIYRGKVLNIHRTGHLYPYKERDYRIANKPYIMLPIKSGEVVECFVRLDSKFNNELAPANLRFTVSPRFLVDEESSRTGIIIYSFMAAFMFIFLYTLSLFLFTRQKVYALYLILVFLALYHAAYNSGYLVAIVGSWGITPIWVRNLEGIASNFYVIAILLFIQEFFQVKERYPLWYKVSLYLIYIFIVITIICYIYYPVGVIMFILVGIIVAATVVVIVYKSTKEKYPAAVYLLIGYLVFLFAGLVDMLSIVRLIPRNDWTFTYSLPLGSLIEVIFFSIALANRYKLVSQENENIKLFYEQEILKTQLEIREQTFTSIAGALHDNVGQLLSLIRLHFYKIERRAPHIAQELISEPKKLIDIVIQEIRDISKMLNPDYFSELGLANAIKQQLTNLSNTGSYETHLLIVNEVVKNDSKQELIVFRIVQELLNNIIKHAEATVIHIQIDYQTEKLVITIQDNGKGFENNAPQIGENRGQGLLNMFRRISLINGSMEFKSEPGKGTTVTIVVYQL